MNANAETVDYASAKLAYHVNARARRDARDALTNALKRKAQAEHEYRRALSVAFAKHRSKGEGQAEAEIHSKAEAAGKALDRDMADAEAKGATARLQELEGERASLRQLTAWSMSIDGAGE